jgi:hypothetical protein
VLGRLCGDRRLRVRLEEFLSLRPSNLRERRDGRRITSKARLLDPLVKVAPSSAVPLSEFDPNWHRDNAEAHRRAEIGVLLLTPA